MAVQRPIELAGGGELACPRNCVRLRAGRGCPLFVATRMINRKRPMRNPDFVIAGAPKCGTTALYSYLKDRPDVFMPEFKEPHFFASDFRSYRQVSERDAYLAMFAGAAPDAMVGEASVWYLLSQVAVPNIMRANPSARVIVMLRNPVDMVHALHSQLLHALDEDVTDFERAWALQEARAAGRNIPRHCRNTYSTGPWARSPPTSNVSISTSPEERVLMLLFKDFARYTHAAYAETLRFLGLPQVDGQSFDRINASRARHSHLLAEDLRHLVACLGPAKPTLNALGLHPGRAIEHWNDRPQARAPLPPRFRTELKDLFREDIDRMEARVGRSPNTWRAA
jgi:hypothetical protein